MGEGQDGGDLPSQSGITSGRDVATVAESFRQRRLPPFTTGGFIEGGWRFLFLRSVNFIVANRAERLEVVRHIFSTMSMMLDVV